MDRQKIKSTFLKGAYVVACVVASLLIWKLGHYFYGKMHFWWPLAGIMDWPIFVDYASRYINTGQLYEQNLMLYGPGEPIYKFPPLFVSALVFCFQQGISEESLRFWCALLQISLYFFTAAVLLLFVKRNNSFLVYPVAGIFLLTFEAFFDNFLRLQLEIYVVFLLSLGVVLLIKKRYFGSGFFLGFAAGLKIYPVFFCVGLVLARDYRALTGVVAGLISSVLMSLTIINGHEHWHYFVNIVPFMFSENIHPTPENISMSYFLFLLGLPAGQASLAAKICLVLAPIVVVAGVLKNNHQGNDEARAFKIASGFSVLIAGFVLGTQNSWWNYQLLLMIPVMVMAVVMTHKRYFRWCYLLALLAGCLFIYCGSIEQLGKMMAVGNAWLGDPNPLQPLLESPVYLRTMASVLIYLAVISLYWRITTKPL